MLLNCGAGEDSRESLGQTERRSNQSILKETKIMAGSPITSWNIEGEKMEALTDFIFLGFQITVDSDCSHEIKRHLLLGSKTMSNLDRVLKSRERHSANKGQSCDFSSSHVWMWELEHKEDWVPKNWCFGKMVLEKTLESPLDCKEIKPVNPKGNQPWIFIGKTGNESPKLWPPVMKSRLIGKDPDAGKDGELKEKEVAEDEMVRYHH